MNNAHYANELAMELRLAQLLHPERRFAIMDMEIAYIDEESRNPCVMPSWAFNNGQAFELQIEHGVRVDMHNKWVTASTAHGSFNVHYADHKDKFAASRIAIMKAAIRKLESEHESIHHPKATTSTISF